MSTTEKVCASSTAVPHLPRLHGYRVRYVGPVIVFDALLKIVSESIEHDVQCTYMCILYQVIHCVDDPIAVARMTELHTYRSLNSNVVEFLAAHYGVLKALSRSDNLFLGW